MEYLEETEGHFAKLLDEFKEELLSVRTNRPSPKLLEEIPVNYMETQMALKQLGSIMIEPPRDLVVNIWDENAVKNVANAIEAANMGFGVSVQGKSVRAKLPDLTEERKQELVKLVKGMAEDVRIKMRQQREDANKEIKEISDEDDMFRAKEDLQKMVDRFNTQVDEIVGRKTEEILE